MLLSSKQWSRTIDWSPSTKFSITCKFFYKIAIKSDHLQHQKILFFLFFARFTYLSLFSLSTQYLPAANPHCINALYPAILPLHVLSGPGSLLRSYTRNTAWKDGMSDSHTRSCLCACRLLWLYRVLLWFLFSVPAAASLQLLFFRPEIPIHLWILHNKRIFVIRFAIWFG